MTTTTLTPTVLPCSVFWFFLILTLAPSLPALSLPQCTESWQKDQGYTYLVDPSTGQRVWSFCHFPDPRHDLAFCGLSDWSQPSFVCDPENLIGSQEDVQTINEHLLAIQTSTSHQCTGPAGSRQSFIMAVVVVGRIRVGDPYSADSCVNDCGEIYPTVNTSARAPTSAELDTAMQTFADGVRLGLNLGACGNDLVLVYSHTYNRVYTSMGSKVEEVVDSSTMSELHATFLEHVEDDDLKQALIYIARQLRSQLRGLTPATIMLIITVVSAVLLLLCMVFFLRMSDMRYDVWGHEGASRVVDIALKMVCGVYLLDGMFRLTAQLSGRLPAWPLVLLFVAALACLVFYTTDIYTQF